MALVLVLPRLAWGQTAPPVAPDLDARIHTVETSLGPRGSDDPTIRWSIEERMRHYGVPGVSVAVIFGLGPEIDGEGPTLSFVHGGANDSYRAFMAGYLVESDGLVSSRTGRGERS